MKIGSLFAGIGGFDLAARWVGWETKWYSEIDEYACKVMDTRFPRVRNVGDITKWEPETGDAVDVVCGGFPCQPVSYAGQRLGQDDPRWLWPHLARIVRVLRPRYVIIENVPGLRSKGMADVLADVAEVGYDAEWETISAASVGAPHIRERVWIIAYPNGEGEPALADAEKCTIRSRFCRAKSGPERERRPSNCYCAEPHPDRQSLAVGERKDAERTRAFAWPEFTRNGWWSTEPDVGRVAYGVPSRVDRLKCLGNSIVPQVARFIFQQIQRREDAIA